RAFLSLLLLVGSSALAAAPESVKVETAFHVDRGNYKVTGTALLHKETDKKLEYRGVVKIENVAVPEDVKTADANLTIKKKKDKYAGALSFGGLRVYSFSFVQAELLPAANEPFRAEFLLQQYDPGPPGGISIWWPIASHATELTVRY
ncbi:MAG TPA: hypothetical protein VM598_04760, partial [Bdellovibrionota bacterium]|nr:hypothetical protein [Bdellovibrionota bacterium]